MLVSQVLHGATPQYIQNELPYGYGLYCCEVAKKLLGIEEKPDLSREIEKIENNRDAELNVEEHFNTKEGDGLNG